MSGKRYWIKLGLQGDVTPEQARTKAKVHQGTVAKDGNVKVDKVWVAGGSLYQIDGSTHGVTQVPGTSNFGSTSSVVLNEATHEIPRQYLDCAKARRVLDWRPAHSLEDGLCETIAWYRDYLTTPQLASNTTAAPC